MQVSVENFDKTELLYSFGYYWLSLSRNCKHSQMKALRSFAVFFIILLDGYCLTLHSNNVGVFLQFIFFLQISKTFQF